MNSAAVCSWSLRPTGIHDLIAKVHACGLSRVQLALDPIRAGAWNATETYNALAAAGITVVSGMMGMKGEDYSTLQTIKATGGIRPSDTWADNLRAVHETARLAHRMGLRLVTFHAGFLPHETRDPEFAVLVDRLVKVIDTFAAFGVCVAFETGQETAETLLIVLREIERRQPMGNLFGVNFDPANMILYGMGEPVESLRKLAPWVRQIHIKDAVATAQPGTWGRETPVGKGAVRWDAFFEAVRALQIRCDLVIEREDGGNRTDDVIAARDLVSRLAPKAESRTINLGVVGLGFMGRTHVAAINSAAAAGLPCRLVAVSDRDTSRLSGEGGGAGNLKTGADAARLFDPAVVKGYADPAELFARSDIDAVSICTHTDTHVELAIAAMRAGKHVLVEKPVALTSADVQMIATVAHQTRRLCMPALCMRFWPGWTDLLAAVRDHRYGAVRSAAFQRLGGTPDWSPQFYLDPARSGGSLMDLHIHDADFVYALFGPPAKLVSTGSPAHVSTQYRYHAVDGPPHVVAEGGQDHSPGFGFKMRFVVVFEHATLDWDLTRTPPLLLSRGGKSEPFEIAPHTAYEAEVRHFISAVATGRRDLAATIEDALNTTRMLEAERTSIATWHAASLDDD